MTRLGMPETASEAGMQGAWPFAGGPGEGPQNLLQAF